MKPRLTATAPPPPAPKSPQLQRVRPHPALSGWSGIGCNYTPPPKPNQTFTPIRLAPDRRRLTATAAPGTTPATSPSSRFSPSHASGRGWPRLRVGLGWCVVADGPPSQPSVNRRSANAIPFSDRDRCGGAACSASAARSTTNKAGARLCRSPRPARLSRGCPPGSRPSWNSTPRRRLQAYLEEISAARPPRRRVAGRSTNCSACSSETPKPSSLASRPMMRAGRGSHDEAAPLPTGLPIHCCGRAPAPGWCVIQRKRSGLRRSSASTKLARAVYGVRWFMPADRRAPCAEAPPSRRGPGGPGLQPFTSAGSKQPMALCAQQMNAVTAGERRGHQQASTSHTFNTS